MAAIKREQTIVHFRFVEREQSRPEVKVFLHAPADKQLKSCPGLLKGKELTEQREESQARLSYPES